MADYRDEQPLALNVCVRSTPVAGRQPIACPRLDYGGRRSARRIDARTLGRLQQHRRPA